MDKVTLLMNSDDDKLTDEATRLFLTLKRTERNINTLIDSLLPNSPQKAYSMIYYVLGIYRNVKKMKDKLRDEEFEERLKEKQKNKNDYEWNLKYNQKSI